MYERVSRHGRTFASVVDTVCYWNLKMLCLVFRGMSEKIAALHFSMWHFKYNVFRMNIAHVS